MSRTGRVGGIPTPRRPKIVHTGAEARELGLVALGVGLAAAGAGAVLGLAAERATASRLLGRVLADPEAAFADPRGGPPLGSLRGEARIVMAEDGVPLHVEIDEPERGPDGTLPPSGLTIVFTHGYALTLDSWHYQRLALRGGHRLVFWDQRGHGRSGTGPEGGSTIEQVGSDLDQVLEAVTPEGPLVLVGHSMGGMTVMSLAQRRPDLFEHRVAAVGLVSTSAGGLAELDLGLAGFGKLVLRAAPVAARTLARRPKLVAQGRRVVTDFEAILVRRYSFASDVPSTVVRFSAAMIAATRVDVISDFLPAFTGHDKREAVAAMTDTEVVVMVGDKDLLTPPGHSEELARLLPEAEHVLVRNGGHLLMLEHPDVVTAHLEELVERALVVVADTRRSARRRGWGRRTVTPVLPRRRSRQGGEGRSQ